MEELQQIILLALVLERVIQVVKHGVEKQTETIPGYVWPLVSAGIGLAAAWTYHMDILARAGVGDKPTVFGFILTGIAIGAGSNFLHDLFKVVRK